RDPKPAPTETGPGASAASLARVAATSISDGFSGVLRTFSGRVHDGVEADRSDTTVAQQLPTVSAGPHEARPSAARLRATKLDLLPGKPDAKAARKLADAALAKVDWSKPDLVVWVPATDEHYFPSAMRAGVKRQFGDRASTVLLDYPADWNFAESVSTGMEALRLFLAGVAEHGGDRRVLLAGHSQGAWVIGDAMADPAVHAAVDRAVLLGDPGLAVTHYTDRRDAKVVEVTDRGDRLGAPVDGREALLEGMSRIDRGDTVGGGAELAGVAVHNPQLATYLAARSVDPGQWKDDPHRYEHAMGDAATFLDAGTA
ncbi:MAG: Cutinase, partial [Thermoleophilia bacterium]|nr:Cutinase [Thermoleophilia bacterium]